MADEQVTVKATGDKTPTSNLKQAQEMVDVILCELSFIRDGFMTAKEGTPRACDELSVTGGVTLLEHTIERVAGLCNWLYEVNEEASHG